MKSFWSTLSSLAVPVGVLLVAMPYAGVAYNSSSAVAVLVGFMVLKLVLEHFFFEPKRLKFSANSRAGVFHAGTALVYSMLAVGTIQMFLLASKTA